MGMTKLLWMGGRLHQPDIDHGGLIDDHQLAVERFIAAL
jgi:hypothetical protein